MSKPLLTDEETLLLENILESEDREIRVHFGIRGIVYLNLEENIYKKGLDYYEELLNGLEKRGFSKKHNPRSTSSALAATTPTYTRDTLVPPVRAHI